MVIFTRPRGGPRSRRNPGLLKGRNWLQNWASCRVRGVPFRSCNPGFRFSGGRLAFTLDGIWPDSPDATNGNWADRFTSTLPRDFDAMWRPAALIAWARALGRMTMLSTCCNRTSTKKKAATKLVGLAESGINQAAADASSMDGDEDKG